MEICKILINKIEKLCDTNNITTNQMLLKCGLAKDVVNNMKKEKPSIPSVDKIYAIAQYFNVSSDYLLGLDDISNIKNDNINLNKDEAKLLSIFRELPPTFQSNLLERADAFKFANEVALNEEETA